MSTYPVDQSCLSLQWTPHLTLRSAQSRKKQFQLMTRDCVSRGVQTPAAKLKSEPYANFRKFAGQNMITHGKRQDRQNVSNIHTRTHRETNSSDQSRHTSLLRPQAHNSHAFTMTANCHRFFGNSCPKYQ